MHIYVITLVTQLSAVPNTLVLQMYYSTCLTQSEMLWNIELLTYCKFKQNYSTDDNMYNILWYIGWEF